MLYLSRLNGKLKLFAWRISQPIAKIEPTKRNANKNRESVLGP